MYHIKEFRDNAKKYFWTKFNLKRAQSVLVRVSVSCADVTWRGTALEMQSTDRVEVEHKGAKVTKVAKKKSTLPPKDSDPTTWSADESCAWANAQQETLKNKIEAAEADFLTEDKAPRQ